MTDRQVAGVARKYPLASCACYGDIPCRAHAHLLAAVAAEREACARVLEDMRANLRDPSSPSQCSERGALTLGAERIRRRGP